MAENQPDKLDPRKILALLLGYFAVQILMRLWLSHSVEIDEAEQLVMTQEWHWGYTVQPPLYTWLQKIFFGIFGLNVFALVLLKNLCLCGTFIFIYASAKEMTGSVRAAIAATTSLFLIPQIAWESQRDQTHSVLATMLAAALLFIFLRLAKKRSLPGYLLFGLCATLGCLSKYNFAVFIVALLLAAATLKSFRPVVRHWGMLLAALVFVAVITPHIGWMRSHPDELFVRAHEVHEHAAHLWLAYIQGFASLALAVAAFSGLAAFAYAALFFRSPTVAAETPETKDFQQLSRRILLVGLLICVGMILGFQAHFKDRWMQPLLFATPIFLVMEIHRRLDAIRLKRLLLLNSFVAGAMFMLLNGTPAWAAATNHTRYLSPDYASLAAQLKARGFTNGVIAAESRRIAGNLKFYYPDTPVLATECPHVTVPRNVPWLVIWSADQDVRIPPLPTVTNMIWTLRGVDVTQEKPILLDAPYEHGHGATTRFAYLLYAPDAPANPPAKAN